MGWNSAFYSWRSFTCCLNAATLRATPHLCISEFSSLRDAFKGTYAVLQELHFYGKPHAKKPGCRRIPGFPKQAME
ncbi:hypothetical protein CDN93_21295 [Escherichia coli]|uniref:Uncharacterized protein n=3 Tax=Enterobacteriaceae TaxID=543 RepID=A0A2A2XF79_ECOLX|nr:hypothetical protein BE957_05335 [Escherichia coli]ATG64445.1 hypothetical protein AWA97_23415 [Escherichia coli O104:H21 str. CFSAN002236]EFK53345.1 hypothetical protein HMPREF9345_00409 [Escherichia coli MS 107-1]EFO2015335.1 hypothetical protein [Escherichia coli O8]EFO2079766.1 hypothetical protein [Escherichia coli O409]EFO3145011.1 hypothetical protein [Escherichia coli O19]EGU97397.1 sulfate transporter [Escherichia coli MS 79-10]OYE76393.1 hypothetical protein CI631_16920 [Shigell